MEDVRELDFELLLCTLYGLVLVDECVSVDEPCGFEQNDPEVKENLDPSQLHCRVFCSPPNAHICKIDDSVDQHDKCIHYEPFEKLSNACDRLLNLPKEHKNPNQVYKRHQVEDSHAENFTWRLLANFIGEHVVIQCIRWIKNVPTIRALKLLQFDWDLPFVLDVLQLQHLLCLNKSFLFHQRWKSTLVFDNFTVCRFLLGSFF